MKHAKLKGIVGLMALTLVWSVGANALCEIVGTNAASVQVDSGNGTYNCAVVTTSKGELKQVYPLNEFVPPGTEPEPPAGFHVDIIENPEGSDFVKWWVELDGEGNPLHDVDLVSVSRNSGQRCNYVYPDQPTGGTGLTTSDGGLPLYVTVCADGYVEELPPPPPPEPISTLSNNCDASFNYDSVTGEEFDLAIGYTKQFLEGGFEGAAICTKGGGQRECVNECVPPETVSEDCTPENGQVSLDCAPCELEYPDPVGSDKDLKYCWYWENRVCDEATWPVINGVPTEPGYCTNRADYTYIPSPKKKSLNAQIDVTTGSDCYTVTVGPLYGGYTYSYQYCPPE